jgi:hypothetical protein
MYRSMVMDRQQVTAYWQELSRKFPLVCGLKTFNAELTIYAVLQQAYKQFDFVVITDDGSTDGTAEEIGRCVADFQIKNIACLDVSAVNPWEGAPVEKREGDHHIPRPGGKTHAKAQHKSYAVVKQNFPNSIYVSLEDDVILEENVRWRIYDRISKWTDPFTDCEFFNVSSVLDDDHILLGCFPDGRPLPGIVQRRLYNNGGDWTLAAIWTASDLQLGPDPVYPFGACLYPWLPKNQTGKKGQCGDKSFGFHMLNYRTTKDGMTYDANVPGVRRIDDVASDADEADWQLLKRVRIPRRFKLRLAGDKYIQELQ